MNWQKPAIDVTSLSGGASNSRIALVFIDSEPAWRYRYTGKPFDEDGGIDIYYYGARYYDPLLGRFLAIDPQASKYPGWSPYLYTLDNPLKYYDPDGKDAVPIVFKDYLIQTDAGRLPKLGHASVLLINNESGFTRYFEYGRYDTPEGEARSYPVSNVTMDSETGMPTAASMGRVLAEIAKKSGKSGDITAAYIKNDEFQAMVDYAEGIKSQKSNPDRTKYDALTNNCTHFVKNVLEAGGVDTPWMVDPRPNSYIGELRDRFKRLQATAKKRWEDVYDVENN